MIISRTPFRLPLGGGGTDLPSYYQKYGGCLVSGALNLHMNICINEPAMVQQIKLSYSQVESVDLDQIDQIKHDIVRESLKYLKIQRPLEISSMADISGGTGLGSSSSYTVGLLNGLNAVLRRYVSVQELAEEACHIEMERIGKPIGKQDQYAAAFGGIVALQIDRSGRVEVERLELEPEFITELEHRLLLFYTNIQRDANKILESKGEGGDESMHRIRQIGEGVKKALLDRDIRKLGELFDEHWIEKRKISSQMSSSQIDGWYELAKKNGAIGGKIMGAGGGGFFIFCVEEGKRKELRSVLERAGLQYVRCSFDFEGSKIIGNFRR